MANRYRSFKQEFVDYMEMRGGWPPGKVLCAGLRAKGYSAKSDSISRARNGRSVPIKYTYNLIEFLLETKDEDFAQSRRAVLDYLRKHGLREVNCDRMQAILSHLCDQPTHDRAGEDEADSKTDWIRRGAGALADYYVEKRVLSRAVQGDPEEAARWVYIRLAQCLHENGMLLDDERCCEIGEKIVGEPFQEHVRRMQSWKEFNPWTVVAARKGPRTNYGVSILLPTTERVYEEIRAGDRRLYDVEPDDLRVPSNHIVFLALAENPRIMREGKVNPTKIMLMALVAQHGALMRYGASGLGERYRLVAPEATEENLDRMVAGGFRALDATDPTGRALWERVMDLETKEGVKPVDEMMLRHLTRLAPSAPVLS